MNDQEPTDIPGKWYPQPFSLESVPSCTAQSVCTGAFVVKNLISRGDCERLIAQMLRSGNAEPVGVYGYKSDDSAKGSFRATAWSHDLCNELWQRFAPFFSGIQNIC